MCGRYFIAGIAGDILPSQEAPVWVREGAVPAEERILRWGLVPRFVKASTWREATRIRPPMVNVRAETLTDPGRSYWREILQRGRGVVKASGFYEWQSQSGGTRQKWRLTSSSAESPELLLAGVWERWVGVPSGEVVESFAILTCPANTLLSAIHNDKMRMPVVLAPGGAERWLNPETPIAELTALLVPAPEDALQGHPEGEPKAAAHAPIDRPATAQLTLF